jgi:hypothetical protein
MPLKSAPSRKRTIEKDMQKKRSNRFFKGLMLVLAFNLAPYGGLQVAHAATIGNIDYAQHSARDDRLARIHAFMTRQEVRSQLVGLGVNAQDVDARLATLTDDELTQLDQRIGALPAGGDGFLAVIGIVFLVLIILELCGVTHIFSKF